MNRANKLLFITIEEEIVAFDFNEVDIDKAVSGITNVTMSNPCVGLVVNDRNEVDIKISATIGEQIKIVYDNGVEQNLNELYNIQKMIGNMERSSIFSSILTCIDLDIANDIANLMHVKLDDKIHIAYLGVAEDFDEETAKLIETLRSEYKRITDAYVDKQYSEVLTSGESKDKRKNKYSTTKTSGKTKITKEEVDKDKLPKGVDKEEIKVITLSKNASIDSVIKAMTTDENAGINMIKSKLDYELIGTYVDLLDTEERTLKILSKEVEKHPMWDKFFKDVKGYGPLMAAVCLAYFDVNKARHVASFWKYTGLDTIDVVKEDGTIVNEGRAAKHAKFTEIEYIDKDGEVKTKHGLGYNPVLKTKLVGVLGSCLLKAGLRTVKDENGKAVLDENGNKQQTATSVYVQCYLDYMHRLNNRADSQDLTAAHKHAMANRYMIKMFIRDLWVTWRAYEGYEVSKPYEVEKLGYKPHKYNEYHDRIAEQTQSRKVV